MEEKHDDASFHTEGTYPNDVPRANATHHIGFFLAWAVKRGWAGPLLENEFRKERAAVKEGRMTGPALIRLNDGRLTSDLLSDDGNDFAEEHYDDYEARFAKQVKALGCRTTYHTNDDTKFAAVAAKILDGMVDL